MPRYQRVPPRRPISWARTARLWAALAGAGVLLALLVAWSERLPEPRPAAAPAAEFSAARAIPTLAYLADTIGHRLPGTAASAAARAHLVARLRALPGVEVAVQDAVGVRATSGGPLAFRVRNVLARIPGRRPDAVLVSTHYDSPAESVGAADAGIAVAASVELARALAGGERLPYSVILNLSDGEEQGLLGSHGFLQHPWARDVRAVVNLESAGNEGKAILFQAGPQNAWLTRRYAASVPHPYGSVIGQDIFQSGLIPSSTDFEVYARAGLRGLDIAFYRGGWAYHTALDRAGAVEPGSVQHMGANALALVRALAEGPLPGDAGGPPSVYYDVLGVWMAAYGQTLAWMLAAAVLVLWALAVRAALARHGVPGRELAAAFAWTTLGAVAAVVVTVATAAVGPYLLGRAHGWFARPLWAAAAYGGTALAVLATVQWRLGARRAMRDLHPDARWLAAWAGALVLHALLFALLTIAGVGSAYLFGWWLLGGAVGLLLLAMRGDGRWRLATVVGLLPGAVLTMQTAVLLVALFVPVAGRFPLTIPFDLVLAAIIAVAAVVLLAAPVALLQRGERVGVAAALAAAAAVVALVVVWSAFPYRPDRPQRLIVTHESGPGGAALAVQTLDFPGPARAVAAVGEWPLGPATVTAGEARYPAPPLADPPAGLELVSERRTADGRELDLRLLPGDAYSTSVRAPAARTPRWQVAGDPARREHAGSRLALVAAPDDGWLVTLRVTGTAPVALETSAWRHTPSTAARDLMRRFPRWSTSYAERVVRATATF